MNNLFFFLNDIIFFLFLHSFIVFNFYAFVVVSLFFIGGSDRFIFKPTRRVVRLYARKV